jgi:hypothetical protein
MASQFDMQPSELGRLELLPGIGPACVYRVVVIDLQNQTGVQRKIYRGVMENPQSLHHVEMAVTWTPGGAASKGLFQAGSRVQAIASGLKVC